MDTSPRLRPCGPLPTWRGTGSNVSPMRLSGKAGMEMLKEISMRRVVAAVLVAGLSVSPAGMPLTAVAQQGGGQVMTIHQTVNRVLTNVVVRDKKTGAVIKGLKQSDFQVLEDKKPQQ